MLDLADALDRARVFYVDGSRRPNVGWPVVSFLLDPARYVHRFQRWRRHPAKVLAEGFLFHGAPRPFFSFKVGEKPLKRRLFFLVNLDEAQYLSFFGVDLH